ncbi:hypothetical protein [Aurantimonas sp. VKM B-3413]|uniref:hypothetical protein n=1 Tax=Aurantimonas sp. VKM B-3413 TaxID=2779401 RepID=UPI001E2E850C|nr:hypothetical protein [Aurantimonas sp. VKM B-3413]MCB8836210.1 hypothetical protein [Aurantimonas sp. VKM B-3413]
MAKNRRTKLALPAGAGKSRGLDPDRRRSGASDLVFLHTDRLDPVCDPIFEDVSSLVAGRSLFCTFDETSAVERVILAPETRRAGEGCDLALGSAFDLPTVRGADHAEGLVVTELHGEPKRRVACDLPHQDRGDAANQRLTIDVFDLGDPGRAGKRRGERLNRT